MTSRQVLLGMLAALFSFVAAIILSHLLMAWLSGLWIASH